MWDTISLSGMVEMLSSDICESTSLPISMDLSDFRVLLSSRATPGVGVPGVFLTLNLTSLGRSIPAPLGTAGRG